MKLLRILLTVLAACAVESCVVPFPHRTHLREGFSGKVVDRGSKRAVSGATVVVDYGRETVSTVTRRDGRFRASGRYIQHWALMLSPLRMSLLPARGGISLDNSPQRPRGIEISKPGYAVFRGALLPTPAKPVFRLEPVGSRIP